MMKDDVEGGTSIYKSTRGRISDWNIDFNICFKLISDLIISEKILCSALVRLKLLGRKYYGYDET